MQGSTHSSFLARTDPQGAGPSKPRKQTPLDWTDELSSAYTPGHAGQPSTLSRGNHHLNPIIIPDSDEEDVRPRKGVDRKAKGDSRDLREKYLEEHRELRKKELSKGKDKRLSTQSSTKDDRSGAEDRDAEYNTGSSGKAMSGRKNSPNLLAGRPKLDGTKVPMKAKQDKPRTIQRHLPSGPSKLAARSSAARASGVPSGLSRTLDKLSTPRLPKKPRVEPAKKIDAPRFQDYRPTARTPIASIKSLPNLAGTAPSTKGISKQNAISIDSSDEEAESIEKAPTKINPTQRTTSYVDNPPSNTIDRLSQITPTSRRPARSPAYRLSTQKHVSPTTSQQLSKELSTTPSRSATPSASIGKDTSTRRRNGAFGSHAKIGGEGSPVKPVKGREHHIHDLPSSLNPSSQKKRAFTKTPSFASTIGSPLKQTSYLPAEQSSQRSVTTSPQDLSPDTAHPHTCKNQLPSMPRKHLPDYLGPVRKTNKTSSVNPIIDEESFRPTGFDPNKRPLLAKVRDRPKRPRPEQGVYTIPTIDAPEWPTTQATSTQTTRKRHRHSLNNTTQTKSSPGRLEVRDDNKQSAPSVIYGDLKPVIEGPILLGSPVSSTGDGKRGKEPISGPLTSLDSATSIPSVAASERVNEANTGGDLHEETGLQGSDAEEEEEDLLAKYADFEFAASPTPEAEAPKKVEDIAPEPSQLSSNGDKTVVESEEAGGTTESNEKASQHSQSQSAADKKALTSPERPVLDTAAVAARVEEVKARLREEAEQKEAERQRHYEEAIRVAQEAEDEDEDEKDLSAVFDLLAAPRDSPSDEIQESQPSGKKSKKQDNRDKHNAKLRHSPEINPLDALYREKRKQNRAGITSGYYEQIFARIDGKTQDEIPLPPISSQDDMDIDGTGMQALMHDLPEDLADQSLFKELVGGGEEEVDWSVWGVDEAQADEAERMECDIDKPTLMTVGLKGRLLQSAVDADDFDDILFLLPLPGTLPTLQKDNNTRLLASWVMENIQLGQGDILILTDILCCLLSLDCPHPFNISSSLCDTLCSIFEAKGVAKSVQLAEPTSTDDLPTFVHSREQMCTFVCSIAEVAVNHGKFADDDVLIIAQYLLLVSASATTSANLRKSIQNALPSLWTASGCPSLDIARELLARVEESSILLKGQVRMLLAVGGRSELQVSIRRWFGATLLLEDYFVSTDANALVPDLPILEDGINRIYQELQAEKSDHRKLRYWLIFFSESFNDINALVDMLGDNPRNRISRFGKMIVLAMNEIKVRAFSKDRDHVNKSRLSQLHVNTMQLVDSAMARRRRKMVDSMKGLKAGKGGQARLSFGPKGDEGVKMRMEGEEGRLNVKTEMSGRSNLEDEGQEGEAGSAGSAVEQKQIVAVGLNDSDDVDMR